MSDKEEKRKHYIAERARALAVIYLTRRSDLKIVEPHNDVGLDFTVYIQDEGQAGLRLFGLQLKGAWSISSNESIDDVIGRGVRETQELGPFPFPVCLFFFTMEKTQGWYTWVAEPIVDAEDGAILKLNKDTRNLPLTNQAVDDIVTRVNSWYDATFALNV